MDVLVLQAVGELPLEPLWGSAFGTIILYVVAVGLIGVAGKNLAVASMGSYLTFVFFATHTDIGLIKPLLYVSLTMVIVGMGFKLWRLEGVDPG